MKLVVVLFIRIYQVFSLWKHSVLMGVFGVQSRCKHIPRCSEYFVQQVQQNGTITGLWRGVGRLLSCW